MDAARRREARKNLQRLVEAYLREETTMRWGATPGQIRARAKQLVESRQIPGPLAQRIREKALAIRQSSTGEIL